MDNKLQVGIYIYIYRYIDNRFKTAGSSRSSDFYYDIPESRSIGDNVICYVDNVVIPNSWKAIDAYHNCLYIKRANIVRGNLVTIFKIVTLTENNYNTLTLRDELQAQLSNAFGGSILRTLTYGQVLLRYNIGTNSDNITIRCFFLQTMN